MEGRAVETAGASGDLAIRPECMALSLAGTFGRKRRCRHLAGNLTYLGAETRLALVTPGGVPLVLNRPTAELPESLVPALPWAASEPGTRLSLVNTCRTKGSLDNQNDGR